MSLLDAMGRDDSVRWNEGIQVTLRKRICRCCTSTTGTSTKRRSGRTLLDWGDLGFIDEKRDKLRGRNRRLVTARVMRIHVRRDDEFTI